jgi:flagellar motor switch protein FliM
MTTQLKDMTITRGKLRYLIKEARKRVSQEQTFDDAVEYDWQEPHHFNPDQIAALEALGKKIENQTAKTFLALCQDEFNVSIASFSQYFACKLAGTVSAEQHGHYFLPFTSNKGDKCGYLGIPPETALILISQMLRDSEADSAEGRDISQLEESILLDVSSAILDAFDAVFKEYNGPSIQKVSSLIKGNWPLDMEELEDLCCFNFTVEYSGGSFEFSFTISSDIIEPLSGTKPKTGSDYSAEEIRNMIMQNMHDAPIEVTAQLYSSSISLKDTMSLGVGDILVLEKKIDESFDVLFNKCPCLKAFPAASHGHYALVIAPQET